MDGTPPTSRGSLERSQSRPTLADGAWLGHARYTAVCCTLSCELSGNESKSSIACLSKSACPRALISAAACRDDRAESNLQFPLVLRHLSFLQSIIRLLVIYLDIPTSCSLLTSLSIPPSLSNHVLASNRGANCTRRWTGEEELPCQVGTFKIH